MAINIKSWGTTSRYIERLELALKFYADPQRYNGSNQRNDSDDSFSDGAPYLKDVSRDGGEIARKALGKGK